MKTHTATGRPRNPRLVILEGLREVTDPLRLVVSTWDCGRTKYDPATRTVVPRTPEEMPENDAATLRQTARRAEALAAQLRGIARFAHERAVTAELQKREG